MERDQQLPAPCQIEVHFNSHAHVERDVGRYVEFSEVENFNSHAHVERDMLFLGRYVGTVTISTHTLTWSVTFVFLP